MAEERKRVAGELAAWHVGMVAAMLGGDVQPSEINPYRVWTAKEIELRQKFQKQKFFGRMSQALFGKDVYNQPPEGTP